MRRQVERKFVLASTSASNNHRLFKFTRSPNEGSKPPLREGTYERGRSGGYPPSGVPRRLVSPILRQTRKILWCRVGNYGLPAHEIFADGPKVQRRIQPE